MVDFNRFTEKGQGAMSVAHEQADGLIPNVVAKIRYLLDMCRIG